MSDAPEQPPGRSVFTTRNKARPRARLNDGKHHPVVVRKLEPAQLAEYFDALEHVPRTHTGRNSEAEAIDSRA